MVHQPNGPSSKALGKRPMRNAVAAPSPFSTLSVSADSPAPEDDECSSAPSTRSVHTRHNHKRVLPSRVRRGGVGSQIGTNDIDVNLLDMLKRKGENDPLIPARTVFILTTDSRLVPPASTSEIGLNQIANERYFERPEVIRAYKNQQNIQVPEFIQLDEEMVGGRLRARTGEVESYDLSDAAYEKRHRKHEMFEKRQRLREKEKLQHEHYKLKERLEQLRTMDPNAFISLSADLFGTLEDSTSSDVLDGAEAGVSSAASLHEAERRRRLMLDVAVSLEERYRTLLPPGRGPGDARPATRPGSVSAEPSNPDEDADAIIGDPHLDGSGNVAASRSKAQKLKLRVSTRRQPIPPPIEETERTRRRRESPVASESTSVPPELDPMEESAAISPPRSISSRQMRFRAREQSASARYMSLQPNGQEHKPVETPHSPFTLSNHPSSFSTNDHGQFFPSDHLQSNGVSHLVDYGGTVPVSAIQESTSFATSPGERSRRSTLQSGPFNVIQYVAAQEQEPFRKKKKSFHSTVYDGLPSHNEIFKEVPDHIMDFHAAVPAITGPERNLQPATTTTSATDEPPSEAVDLEPSNHAMSLELDEDRVGDAKDTVLLQPVQPPIPFAQLRQLEKPDLEGEFELFERPDVDETPTADEPITPPVEPEPISYSPVKQTHHTYSVPATTETASKRRKRKSTPLSRRETSTSLPPELLPSTSLSIVSMESYELLVPGGTRKKPKPLGYLMATSKYNQEPGRKTGRSVKAFGVEVPPFDQGKDEEFELPDWMIHEVHSKRRISIDSDGESDGDPPSFIERLAKGELQHSTFPDSISAAGQFGADRLSGARLR